MDFDDPNFIKSQADQYERMSKSSRAMRSKPKSSETGTLRRNKSGNLKYPKHGGKNQSNDSDTPPDVEESSEIGGIMGAIASFNPFSSWGKSKTQTDPEPKIKPKRKEKTQNS